MSDATKMVRIEARFDRDDEDYVNAVEVPEADVDETRRTFQRLYGYAAVVKEPEKSDTAKVYESTPDNEESESPINESDPRENAFRGYPEETSKNSNE